MIRLSSILLALAALGTGLLAAYKWYKASKVQIDLGYTYPGSQAGETYRRMGKELTRSPEPMEAELTCIMHCRLADVAQGADLA
jgi:hypothetical protein